jgi:hypothetical protein
MAGAILHIHLALGLFLLVAIAAGKLGAWRAATVPAVLLALLSGAYNFMTRMAGAPGWWHAAAGVKILLALHVTAMVLLGARGGAAPARRRMVLIVSASLTVLIGLWLSNLAGRAG